MKPKFKLTRGGIQYLDEGGSVLPSTTVSSAGGPSGTIQAANLPSLLTTQNGYNAQLAPITQTDYGGLMNTAGSAATQGFGQFNQNLGNENALAQQLVAEGNGQGPNPALAQLNQQTGQNVNTQAALAAGVRGANSNAGLLARQVAQQGAATQQNAIGQAATLQAQQQLGAQQAASGLYGNIGSQTTAEQNANNSLLNTAVSGQNAQNNAILQNYGQVQGINSQVSQNNANAVNKTAGGLENAAGGILSGSSGTSLLSAIGLASGGIVPNLISDQTYTGIGGQSSSQTQKKKNSSSDSQDNSTSQEGDYDSNSATYAAKGGEIENPKLANVPQRDRFKNNLMPSHIKKMAEFYHPHLFMDDGGEVPDLISNQDYNGIGSTPMGGSSSSGGKSGGGGGSALSLLALLAKGGEVNSQSSPTDAFSQGFKNATGTNSLKGAQPPSANPTPANANYAWGGMPMLQGGNVPGKAKVKGDSLKNDVVPAKLSPGEVVIPRSIMQSDDPAGNAAKFVASIASKHQSADEEDDFKQALKKAISSRKSK